MDDAQNLAELAALRKSIRRFMSASDDMRLRSILRNALREVELALVRAREGDAQREIARRKSAWPAKRARRALVPKRGTRFGGTT